jgi:hypothetical protein
MTHRVEHSPGYRTAFMSIGRATLPSAHPSPLGRTMLIAGDAGAARAPLSSGQVPASRRSEASR